MKSWKIYSIVITVVLALVIIGICLYAFVFKENISDPNAKEIAFNYANVLEKDVTILSTNKDIEDREYEIRFYDDTYEYEIDVNYNNGTVRNFEKDIKNNTNQNNNINNNNYSNTNINSNTDNNTEEYIGTQRAKEIALTDAGVNESNITLRKVELDVEHYDPIYEIEFYYNNVEYDYEIDAITGEIIKYERKK